MRRPQPAADAAEVSAAAAFLRAHPRFLADNPALYATLVPPARVHGDRLADHMAAMLQAARARAEAMARHADDVLVAGRASAGLAGRVQDAVLALMRAQDKVDCIATELVCLLAVDAVSLCVEANVTGMRSLAPGTVARLLGTRPALFRPGSGADADGVALHGEAAALAQHEALVLVPGQGPPMLIALLVRDGANLDPAQGAGSLAFLGRAAAAALGR